MHKPYLIDNLKFDLRVYVLVYGVDPLRVFVFKEGLARFATEPYTGPYKNNLDNLYMHLTNYAINKGSGNFVKAGDDDDSGHKRSMTSVLAHMEETEENFNAEDMMDSIEDIAVKTVIAG
jgi:tubulin polyglutamylase TTLL6/13